MSKMMDFLPAPIVEVPDWKLGTASAMNFVRGIEGDTYKLRYTYTLDMSMLAFVETVRELVLNVVGTRPHPFEVRVNGFDANDFAIRVGEVSAGRWDMMIGLVRDSRSDLIDKTRAHFTVHINANNIMHALKLGDALKDAFGNKHLPVVEWHFQAGNETRSASVILDPAPEVYDEFYPWIDGGVKAAIKSYMEDSASLLFLSGKPGTGKTSLVRWMLQEYGLCAVVTYEEKLLSADGMFVDFIIDNSKDMLIIEDADTMLSSRSSENNKLIARFLNVSDGLIKFKRKKVVFTTNLGDFKKIDEALVRPGRCFGQVACRALTFPEAMTAARVAGIKPPREQRDYTIAELFNQDAKTGFNIKPMGFDTRK